VPGVGIHLGSMTVGKSGSSGNIGVGVKADALFSLTEAFGLSLDFRGAYDFTSVISDSPTYVFMGGFMANCELGAFIKYM
jgi:hypothetical protein